jgi:hypothetical protein
MTIQSTVKLTDDQEKAMALIREGKRHTLLYGGSRSGKTFLIVLCIVLRALIFPGSRHLIYRLRLKDAIQSIWLETLPKVIACFPGLSRFVRGNETRHVLEFPNGSEIWVAGVDDARSEDSVLGKEYVTVYANEASQIPFLTMWKVRTRLAQKVEGCTVREFVDLNPTTRAHWTYKEFVQKLDPVLSKPGNICPVEDPDSYEWCQLNPSGNVENLDAEYIRSLQAAPESMRRRFFEGEYACDDSLLVFPFPETSYYAGKQFDDWVREVGPGNVRFAAGLDLGFNDADGFAIIAYVPRVANDPAIPRDALEAARLGRYVEPEPSKRIRQRWLVYEHKARRNGLSECAKAIQTGLDWATKRAEELGLSSSNILIYTDTGGGGAKMLPDLRNVYKLPVVAAYKRDKKAAIEMLQDDVREGRFMVPADGAFSQESQAIVWTKDPDTGEVIREIDDKQYHPDLMDAILYAMRAVWVQSLIK